MPLWCSGEQRQWHTVLKPRRVDQEVEFPKDQIFRDIPGVTTRFLSTQEVLEGLQVIQGKPSSSAREIGVTEQEWLRRMVEAKEIRDAFKESISPPIAALLEPQATSSTTNTNKAATIAPEDAEIMPSSPEGSRRGRRQHRTRPVLDSVGSLKSLELSADPKERKQQLKERREQLQRLEEQVKEELSKVASSSRVRAATKLPL